MEFYHGDMDMDMDMNMTAVVEKVCKMNMSVSFVKLIVKVLKARKVSPRKFEFHLKSHNLLWKFKTCLESLKCFVKV